MNDLESGKDARSSATAHRFDEDTVAVVIIDNHDVVTACAGRDDKFASLVGMDLARGGFEHGSVAVMGPGVACFAGRKGIVRFVVV